MKNFSKLYSKNNIGLIPTYACNSSCDFCYAKNLKMKFPKEMSWKIFKKVIHRCQKEGKNEISFFGGEATVWKYINEAVIYLKKRKIQVNFFTNGLIFPKNAPDCVLINMHNVFDIKRRRLIGKSMGFYKENKTEIGIRYNVDCRSDKKNDKVFLKIIQDWSDNIDYVSISPAIPYPLSSILGNSIYNLTHKIYRNGQKVRISRAIPICLFNKKQFKFLREECFLHKKCFSVKNIVINPDGKTLYPCVSVFKEKNWEEENLRDITKFYKRYFFDFGHIYGDKCQDCHYSKNYACQMGCLGTRQNKNQNCKC